MKMTRRLLFGSPSKSWKATVAPGLEGSTTVDILKYKICDALKNSRRGLNLSSDRVGLTSYI